MKVKVQCPCGARFEFEVEPLNGRMPVAINCPVCNADATELANAVIRQQSAAPAVGIPIARPASSGLRIAKSTHSPATGGASVPASLPPEPAPASIAAEVHGEEAAPVRLCPKHKGESAVDSCVVCGKPLCLQCLEQFGHVCSVYCRQQATERSIYVPTYFGQKSVIAAKSNVRAKLISSAVALFVVAILGLWFWYAWFARNPKIVYSLSLGDKNDSPERRALRPPEFYHLIAPNQLLSIKGKLITLLDITKKQPLWSAPLKSDSDAEDSGFSNPFVAVTTNDLWLAFPDHLLRLDRQTGALKDSPVLGRIVSFAQQDDSLTVGYITSDGVPTFSRVGLQDGQIHDTIRGAAPVAKPAVRRKQGKNEPPAASEDTTAEEMVNQGQTVTASTGASLQSGVLAATHGSSSVDPTEYLGDATSLALNGREILPFTASGSSVVELHTTLLEHKTVEHQAMKAPPGKSVLDGNVTASQGLELAQEMMNNNQREQTGGVQVEDVSRYQVTLHRFFASDVPDWSGEVTGPPRIYPLKTIDLLIAGQSVIAFDHNNKKLWESKLSYPGDRSPVLETANAVYVADPGVLNCFDRATGSARWRLNSVGISSVQSDGHGNIYLTTTTAGPDKIRYSQEHNLRERIHPVILKVDPATGKVLWRNESVGDALILSGKFLFSTWATQTQSALKLDEGPDLHFYINLLNPANGELIWPFRVNNQRIQRVEVQQKWIMLRFEDRLYVLKFFSF